MSDYRKKADERSYRNRYSKTHHGVLGNSKRIDTDGILGELAFAQFMGLPEEGIETRGPVPYNFRLLDGTRVDVRSTRHAKGRLIVPPAIVQRGRIDVFVLATITGFPAWTEPTVENVNLIGWATAQQVREASIEKISDRPGATPVHCVWQDRLRPMEELRKRNYPQMQSLFGGDDGR